MMMLSKIKNMSLRGTKQSHAIQSRFVGPEIHRQLLFNAPKFGYICIYNGPVFFLKKGNRAVLVKENKVKN